MRGARERRLNEFELIDRLFAPLAMTKGALGLKDDAAIVDPQGDQLVVTTDAVVEGIHFMSGDPAGQVARKALRVNLSDLAAKGARPFGYLMALGLPDHISQRWLREFCSGLHVDQRRFSLSLLGGDTTRTRGPLTIAITALGRVPRGGAILRKGARAGDLVFVSGTIGDAGLGLELLQKGRRAPRVAIDAYRLPEPRLGLGNALRGIAGASIDVSDGLIADLGHVAEVSNVRIVVDAERIPLSDALRRSWGADASAVVRAATSGDDYEIAFVCRAHGRHKLIAAARRARTHVTEIGRVERGRGVVLRDAKGRVLAVPQKGYRHF